MRELRITVLWISVFAAACASEGDPSARAPATDAGSGGHDTGLPGPGRDAGPRRDAGPIAARSLRCGDTPPADATLPPPLPAFSGGVCPALAPGRNTIDGADGTREFLLVVPSDYDGTERLPVLVMWHWLGGAADSFLGHGQVQESVDELRFIAVIPEKKGDLVFDLVVDEFDMVWPYLTQASMARMEEEARFFDDMIACVAAHYDIDESCISTAGVSAGALWSAQLLQLRAERLASAIILSGGIGPGTTSTGFVDVQGWRGATHAMPVMVAWGGATDGCGVNFDVASRNLVDVLDEHGHFVVECIHNCGHTAPPVDPATGLRVLWRFALDHPYWLRDRESPYLVDGMPAGAPTWCGMGAGSATPRTEACGGEGFDAEGCPVGAL